MARTMDDFIATLPSEAQAAIAEETQRLVAEEMTLRELRRLRAISQRMVGEVLHVNQATVSKIERRTDMYLSTLRSYIEALGGELNIVVQFPDRAPVSIRQFGDLEAVSILELETLEVE
ncbi:MAG: helix-turn-helix domain-containing protein [Candidatus Viridilinea halotolerans]|uniref:Helix-turn-helix domain-containing protein n=1 Tax=Candidatus Viridilinea halotolerans TaxID=2491704 RepID=A0A426TV38_9CHLR|nr:MAG: helix-turn-helix domain-containing protein [Candidatus Viridilinea halotolerans]